MLREQETPMKRPNDSLRRERERRGWSQAQVAEKIDAPGSFYISRWERGIAVPSPHYRARLCTLFQKDAHELGFLLEQSSVEERTSSTPETTSPPATVQTFQEFRHEDRSKNRYKWFLLPALFMLLMFLCLTSSSAAPAPPASSCDWPLYTENIARVSTDVTTIQFMLEAHGYSVGSFGIDGSFGPYTEQALRSFQANNGLPASGVVNGPTWQRLIIPSQQNTAGDQVKALQVQLNAHGTRPRLPVTGIFAQKTEKALQQYLQEQHVASNGSANLSVWCVLVGGQLLAARG